MSAGGRLTLVGTVRPEEPARQRSVVGFSVGASLTRVFSLDGRDEDAVKVADAGRGLVLEDGSFRIELRGTGEPVEPITLTVSTPDGLEVHRDELALDEATQGLAIQVPGLERFAIQPSDDPARGRRLTLVGRVIDERGSTVPAGLPVVLWGVDRGDGDTPSPRPLVVAETQAGGYFSGDWVADRLQSAFGRVAGSPPVPVRLDDNGRLPRRALLVLEVPEVGSETTVTPRAPRPADLVVNPEAFSQDLGGGCVDLTVPNRAIEEFSYFMVVRTSEPDVRGMTLGARQAVPPRALAELIEASGLQEIKTGRAAGLNQLRGLQNVTLDAATAKRLVQDERPPSVLEIGKAAWLSEVAWAKDLIGAGLSPQPGRVALDVDHPIRWDDAPMVYQAITLARGHILEFREVWRADGYSLGDLLHSLPLAPGQRRQVAVVDWERRTTTAREEALEFEEELNAFVSRDRDISEIVGSRLDEEVQAGSRNTTWGVAGGIGAGLISGGFGIFGGIAGGAGGSENIAWQDSSRRFASDSLQSLRDRVMQRASSVRDQRATVVQTVAQGETFRAETESVANYNRCHAMTVEYFEVLRHFLVAHELVDVRECLFVPFPLSPFDRGKALRWRDPLSRYLRDRRLAGGFDAIRRIADNWEGWEFPASRYSEEAPESLEGELRVSFVLPRPRDAADGAFQVDMWKQYSSLLPYDALELWTAQMNERAARERDRYFRENVAPGIAERLVARLRFDFVTASGSEVRVPLDGTLVSRYGEGVPLYVTLRPRGGVPPVAREDIVQFKISYDGDPLPADARVIVHSGKVRYRTPYQTGVLFSDERILNDLSNGDPVIVPTPPTRAELRNPREEDRDLADRLVAHLNEAIEHYQQAMLASLDDQRRFMLLDGVKVPGLDGKSVASVVENRLIGVAGNSLVMPLSPGVRLDPRVDTRGEDDLMDLYAANPAPPVRISVPTRGVYAEAVMGDCNACEEIDDTRYWRWTTEGMLAPPEIEAVSTETRAEGEPDLTPTALPRPLVEIQNAPELPAVTGLNEILGLLAKNDLFPDITGLEGTQKNARAAFDAAMSAMSAVAGDAATLARQQIMGRNGERMLDRIAQAREDGLLTPGAAQELSEKALGTLVGEPSTDGAHSSPVTDPDVQKALDEAAQSDKAEIKVSTPEEALEVSFDGGGVSVGGATPKVGILEGPEVDGFVDQVVRYEEVTGNAPGSRKLQEFEFPTLAKLEAFDPEGFPLILGKFLRPKPGNATRYQLFRRLRIAYPSDPNDPKKVAGKVRLPVVVMVHGMHESWENGEVRNHEGFKYLQDHLAQQGIVSVSVDTNAANYHKSLFRMRAEMTLEALDTLRRFDKDEKSRFHNRLDFDSVGLMGHSRGGDGVVRASRLNAERRTSGRYGIKAVCLLAPTDFTGTLVKSQVQRLDLEATGFLLVVSGGLDADVANQGGARSVMGTGFRHYDRATCQKAMVFIPLCTHNRFHSGWTDAEEGVFGLPQPDEKRAAERPFQERLAIEYVGGLFEWKLAGANKKAALFDGNATNTLLYEVSLQWAFGSQVKDLEDMEKPAAGTIASRNVTATIATIDEFADIKVNGKPLEPNTPHQTRILAINPTPTGPQQPALKLEFPNSSRHKNWLGFKLLTFSLGTWIDVTDEATIAAGKSPPLLGLLLEDRNGNTAAIDEKSFTTRDVPGKPIFHQVKVEDPSGSPIPKNENVTLLRLATVAVKLDDFKGVERDNVRRLQVLQGPGFAQHVFLDSFRLVQ